MVNIQGRITPFVAKNQGRSRCQTRTDDELLSIIQSIGMATCPYRIWILAVKDSKVDHMKQKKFHPRYSLPASSFSRNIFACFNNAARFSSDIFRHVA